jgi:regulatory protein
MARRSPDKPVKRSAYEQALGLLARREHSTRELKTKLRAGGQPGEAAAEAIERLQAQRYQDDERFAASLARRRAAQGYGPARIRAELKSHGLRDEAVRAVLAQTDTDWTESAATQLRRHYGAAAPADAAERGRRAAFLLRRGFDAATVRAVTHAETGDSGLGQD